MADKQTVAVLGAGMMGAGIALALGAGRDRRRADRAAPALPSRSFRALDA